MIQIYSFVLIDNYFIYDLIVLIVDVWELSNVKIFHVDVKQLIIPVYLDIYSNPGYK